MSTALALVLVVWPGQPFDLSACRPVGRVAGFETYRYLDTAPRIEPAVAELVGAARKRGADTVRVTSVERIKGLHAPEWAFQWAVMGTALVCEEGAWTTPGQ